MDGVAEKIRTARLLLRPYDPSDAPRMATLAGDWEVARYTAHIPHPYPSGAAEAFIALTRAETDPGEREGFAIVETQAPDMLIGGIGYLPAGHELDIGYWLGRPAWGQGFATEAVQTLVARIRVLAPGRIIRASAMVENEASARVLLKAGFLETGRRRIATPARGTADVEVRMFRYAGSTADRSVDPGAQAG
jgi:RimJ/RimL family protein N-acetyltransferase